jgi:glucose/arabinose dehydrogenase
MLPMKFFSQLILCLTLLCLFSGLAFAAPPAGFQTIKLAGQELSYPTGLAIAPDGRIFVVEQSGNIKIYKNGQILPRIFDQLPAYGSGDRGLLGVTFDPDFGQNHWIYFYYIDVNSVHKVVRFDATEDVGRNGPVEIFSAINNVPSPNHAGGTVAFGPDVKLYISIGDVGNGLNSQDLSTVFGKILRINKDGSIPSDNPFVSNPLASKEIWAYGLRNPFRFHFDSVTSKLYAADVGLETWEEVNVIEKGGNYGWPLFEGACTTTCTYINPIYQYPHNGQGASITGGAIYRGNNFPSDYLGSYFFADYVNGYVKRLKPDANGIPNVVTDFDLASGSVTDFQVAPDGTMYYVRIYEPGLFKVVYNNGNKYPSAVIAADTTAAQPPATIHFSSTGSSDPEGQTLSYLWDFGDGTNSTSANPTKIYTNKGQFNVQLTVNDGVNSVKSNVLVIQIGTPPSISITAPIDGINYSGGDQINYASTATDSNGNILDAGHFETEVIFHHDTHIHPFVRPANTQNGQFSIPTTGEYATDVSYEIVYTVTDDDGLQATDSVNIYPNVTTLDLKTVPFGLTINLNGVPTPEGIIDSIVGFDHTIEGVSQVLNGTNYVFDHWEDNSPTQHSITTTLQSITKTAYFVATVPFSGNYYNNTTLSGTPVLTRNDPTVSFNWGNGSPAASITSDNFSVRWTKTHTFEAGAYNFSTMSDDGVRLYLDNTLIIDNWTDHGPTTDNALTYVTQGPHIIKLEYYEHGGGAMISLSWTKEEDTSTDDIQAQYFTNTTLSGSPIYTATETAVNNIWGTESPDDSVSNDQFSARWTKKTTVDSGLYRFTVTADDGVRLFIDGVKVLDKWHDQPATRFYVDSYLSSGEHTVVMEYYENYGNAVAILKQAKVGEDPNTNWHAVYYTNKYLTGVPVLSRYENDINHLFLTDTVDPTLTSDNFSAIWSKTTDFESGTYDFTVIADDGVRVYVDQILVLDKWFDQPATSYSFTQDLRSGKHTIVVEYYENYGLSTITVNYTKR